MGEEQSKLERARIANGWSLMEVCRRLAKARVELKGGMAPKSESIKRMFQGWKNGDRWPTDWMDELCAVFGMSPEALGFGEQPAASPLVVPKTPPLVAEYGDADFLESARGYLGHLVSLDNRFGAAEIVPLAVRYFKSLRNLLGTGAYDPSLERDLQAVTGELAELGGWLAYDAERHDLVRALNQEALFYTQLAGDRSIELLTLQNASMHAGAMGRPSEALQLANRVLNGFDLSPRLRALFLTRKARALAQGGDESALPLFDEIESLYLEGVRDDDPAWAWWIDERELAWHKAMATDALQHSGAALPEFEHSVLATDPNEMRSQYLHRAFLLRAQINAGSWGEVENTIGTLLPLIPQVESTRTKVLIRESIATVAGRTQKVPDGIETGIAKLGIALDQADALEVL